MPAEDGPSTSPMSCPAAWRAIAPVSSTRKNTRLSWSTSYRSSRLLLRHTRGYSLSFILLLFASVTLPRSVRYANRERIQDHIPLCIVGSRNIDRIADQRRMRPRNTTMPAPEGSGSGVMRTRNMLLRPIFVPCSMAPQQKIDDTGNEFGQFYLLLFP